MAINIDLFLGQICPSFCVYGISFPEARYNVCFHFLMVIVQQLDLKKYQIFKQPPFFSGFLTLHPKKCESYSKVHLIPNAPHGKPKHYLRLL